MPGVMEIYALRRKVLVEGRSQRSVAREMGLARDTGRRSLATPVPERQQRQRSSPVLDQVRPRLEQLLEEWSQRTTAKQRITGRRLHRQQREGGYEVGLTLVLFELREWRRRRAEVYVPLVHRPAESAQVDIFEVRVDLAGERRPVWLLLFRLMHSGRDYVQLYERQDQLAFLDGHVRAFAHFGGVPRRIVYDNLSAAVRRVQFPRRRLSERFAALASHYAFEPGFARPGEGHDKGGVEGRGRGIRWQVLTPLPRGDSLEQISEEMQAEVDRLAPEQVWERFAREGPLLRPLPAVAFEPRRMQSVSVNRSAMVRLEGACALDALARWVLGPRALGGPQDHGLGRRLRGRLPARGAAGRPSPPALRRPTSALPPLPQPALAQAAGLAPGGPELIDELGGPYARLWTLLEDDRGGHEAARALARLLQAAAEHGEERVRVALEPLCSLATPSRSSAAVPKPATPWIGAGLVAHPAGLGNNRHAGIELLQARGGVEGDPTPELSCKRGTVVLAEVVRRLIEDADCGAYALSLDQTIVSWNSRAEELTGFTAESVIGRRCYEVVGGRAAAGVTSVCLGGCPALAQLRSGTVPRSRLMEVLQTSGERTMVRMTPLVMPDDQDRATMLVHLDRAG